VSLAFKVCEVKKFTSVFEREKKEFQGGGDIDDNDSFLT
jgi:hypothetical protein